MLFTSHSHSGQFCTHAVSTLEEVIRAALTRGMTHIALTEHVPRDPQDLYPGESDCALLASQDLFAVFAAYVAEAERLRLAYAGRIAVLVGFESEWIREPGSAQILEGLRQQHTFDLWVGSVHHVFTHPIDFDDETLQRAREAAGGTDADLARAYFDAQSRMLEMRPPVVGHFDLIRLKLGPERRDRDWRTWEGGVWERIERNLRLVKEYGGILEVNSAALRKGLQDVYPRREIMEAWADMGGRLTLSDDSHGVEQLCTHYAQALDCVVAAGVEELWYFDTDDQRTVTPKPVPLQEVRARLAAAGQV